MNLAKGTRIHCRPGTAQGVPDYRCAPAQAGLACEGHSIISSDYSIGTGTMWCTDMLRYGWWMHKCDLTVDMPLPPGVIESRHTARTP